MKILFSNLNTDFDFIRISETWLSNDNKHIYGFDGHHCPIQLVRNDKKGGRVSLFIKDSIEYKKTI